MQQKYLHILICPLDWGLGHAARCIPVIDKLLESGHKVTIAGNGRSLVMLQTEFPLLESIELPGFSPTYSRNGNMVLHLLLRLPLFISSIQREHKQLKAILSKQKIDIIISDNRYGLWDKNTMSILITHQVMIKAPDWLRFAEYFLYRVSRWMIAKFDKCWVPDNKEAPGLSGDLSHFYPNPRNVRFIGPLSRFQETDFKKQNLNRVGKIVAVISGPEPQRSIFERLITKQLMELDQEAVIIGGKPECGQTPVIRKNLTFMPYMKTNELRSLITTSDLVVCRSGYSSIMDLQALGAKALFVPTPGQTEQIYLARLHSQAGISFWCEQDKLDLKTNIPEALKYPGFKSLRSYNGLSAAIDELKKK